MPPPICVSSGDTPRFLPLVTQARDTIIVPPGNFLLISEQRGFGVSVERTGLPIGFNFAVPYTYYLCPAINSADVAYPSQSYPSSPVRFSGTEYGDSAITNLATFFGASSSVVYDYSLGTNDADYTKASNMSYFNAGGHTKVQLDTMWGGSAQIGCLEHAMHELIYGENGSESTTKPALAPDVKYRFFDNDAVTASEPSGHMKNTQDMIRYALARDSSRIIHGDSHHCVSLRHHPSRRVHEAPSGEFNWKVAFPFAPFNLGCGAILNPLYDYHVGSQFIVVQNTSTTANLTARVSGWRGIAVESHARSALTDSIMITGTEVASPHVAPVTIGMGTSMSNAIRSNVHDGKPHQVAVSGPGKDSEPTMSGVQPPDHKRTVTDFIDSAATTIAHVSSKAVQVVANAKIIRSLLKGGAELAETTAEVAPLMIESGLD